MKKGVVSGSAMVHLRHAVSSGEVAHRPPTLLESREALEILGFFDIVDTDALRSTAAMAPYLAPPFENGVGLLFSPRGCRVGVIRGVHASASLKLIRGR